MLEEKYFTVQDQDDHQMSVDYIANVINEINTHIIGDDEFEDPEMYEFGLTMRSDGLNHGINFLGITIWSSENDDREHIESIDLYEPLLPYLMRLMQYHKSRIAKLNLNYNHATDK